MKFYVGISSYKNYNSQDASSFEAGTIFNYDNLFVNIKYFDSDFNLFKPEGFYNPRPLWEVPINNVQGLGLNFNYKYWLLLLETNTSYYFRSEDTNESDPVDDLPFNLPRWQFIGGLYLTGLYFNDNLDLKTGFVFYYTGQINSSENYWKGSTIVNPTNKLDFTLAGEIKKVAIFYFIWENLYYNEYYITPYYPMPDANIRFGIAWELFN